MTINKYEYSNFKEYGREGEERETI